MVCRACGQANPEEARTCRSCGQSLREAAVATVPPAHPSAVGLGAVEPSPAALPPAHAIATLAPGASFPVLQPPDHGMTLRGQVVAGRYVIIGQLGKGGMGTVYRAKDTVLDEEVAIKVLARQENRDPAEVERFKRELKTARQITHPNVIRIHDIGFIGDEPFISMEILAGGSLSDRIRAGKLPLRQAAEIGIGICAGLGTAHRLGIVHRDLKPDNVLFDAAGQPKLLDFGLARWANSTTRTVGFSGTPTYMSPEQADGRDVNARSDLYSLGVLLFELFTGKVPFQSDSLVRLVMLHTKEKPPSLRSIRGDVPPAIEALILRCLEKDPAKRPASAEEIAEGLKGGLTAGPSAGEAPVARRNAPLLYGLVAVLALGAVAGAAWLGVRGVRGSSSPAPSPSPAALASRPASAPAATATLVVAAATPSAPPAATPAGRTLRPHPTPGARPAPTRVATVTASETGTLVVKGDRGAYVQVFVDGKDVDNGDFPVSYRLPAGKHKLRFERAGKLERPVERAINVQPGETLTFYVDASSGTYEVHLER